MHGKTAIVTGAFGYIGNVLTKILREYDYYVIGVDNDPRYFDDRLSNRSKYCNYHVKDDLQSNALKYLLDKYNDATVFHLAASSLLGPSANNPLLYFANNTAKTTWLLNNMRKDRRFIFASTAATYAVTDTSCIEDQSLLDPPNNYGKSKLMTEQMLQSCYKQMNWKSVVFRFFNVAGAYEDTGQLPHTPHIINHLIDCFIRKEVFIIHGNEYPTQDGTCIRDYVHVFDVVRALVHADNFLRDETEPTCQFYNLGSGAGFSVNEVVREFRKTVGWVDVEIGPNRIGDPPYLVASNEKYKNHTGFLYLKNNLRDMIASAWEYRSGRK